MVETVGKSKRRPAFVFLTVFLTLAVVFLLLEVGARVVTPPYYRFSNNSQEYYSNPRGYHQLIRMDGVHPVYGLKYENDIDVYRIPVGAPKTYWKARNAKILGLGDSFMYGVGVRYEDTLTLRLEAVLKESGRNLLIKNCALPGVDTESVYTLFKKETENKEYPLVIYGFTLNDFELPGKENIVGNDFIDRNNGEVVFSPIRERLAIVNLVASSLERIRLHTTTTQAYLDAFEPDHARRNLAVIKLLAREIRDQGGELVIVVFPLLYDFENYRFKKCHQLMHDFAENNHILLLDLLPAYSTHSAKDLWVHPMDHHPNETAHAIAADELFRFLEEKELLPPVSESESALPE